MRNFLRIVLTGLVACVTGIVVGLSMVMTVPQAFNYEILTVLSGSMEPTLDTGGVVIAKKISPLDARLGDVVTFQDPERKKKLVTHRLRKVKIKRGNAYMVTKGDANDTTEKWAVSTKGHIGRVAFHVPHVGFVREWISGKAIRLGTVALLVLFGVAILWDIWKPRPKRGPEEAEEEGTAELEPTPAPPAAPFHPTPPIRPPVAVQPRLAPRAPARGAPVAALVLAGGALSFAFGYARARRNGGRR